MMKLDLKRVLTIGVGVLGLVGVLIAFRLYTLDANLKASTGITKKLKADLESLETENHTMREETQGRQAEMSKLAQELEGLRAHETQSGKRSTELEGLVSDAEKTLTGQNAKIAELESRLKEAEERLKHQREKSESLAGTKSSAGGAADYAKLMESEWLSTLAQTEKLQKELEEAMMELADGNSDRGRMQKEVATMHYNLAVILTNQNKFEAAVREYERVLQIRPQDADAHYNLAVLYDTEIKDHPKALEHYRRYIEAAPAGPDSNKVRLWIKEKEYETRLNHSTLLPKEEKRF